MKKSVIFVCFLLSTLCVNAQNLYVLQIGKQPNISLMDKFSRQLASDKKMSYKAFELDSAQKLLEEIQSLSIKESDYVILAYHGKTENGFIKMTGLELSISRLKSQLFNVSKGHLLFLINEDIYSTINSNNISFSTQWLDLNTLTDIYIKEGYFDDFVQKIQTSQSIKDLAEDNNIYVSEGIPTGGMPNFPTFIPIPTAQKEIPNEFFLRNRTLGSVSKKLILSLQQNGYSIYRFFAVKGGYAIVARMEQIKEITGESKNPPDRWKIGISFSSFADYWNALFYAPKGYYRIVTYIVTNEYLSWSSERATKEQTDEWFTKGAKSLDASVARKMFGKNYHVYALIYEFEINDVGATPKLLARNEGKPSDPMKHLEKSGLWDALSRK